VQTNLNGGGNDHRDLLTTDETKEQTDLDVSKIKVLANKSITSYTLRFRKGVKRERKAKSLGTAAKTSINVFIQGFTQTMEHWSWFLSRDNGKIIIVNGQTPLTIGVGTSGHFVGGAILRNNNPLVIFALTGELVCNAAWPKSSACE